MAANVRTWRAEKVNKPKGTYWLLKTGRNADRVSLTLGYVTTAEAERARDRIAVAEEDGSIGEVLRLHDEDPVGAIQFLVQDGGALSLLPAPKVDYARMQLRTYVDEVYGPARALARPKTWRTEDGHWRRILADLGDLRLDELDARVFIRWARDLRVENSGGNRRPKLDENGRKRVVDVDPSKRNRPASGSYQRLLRAALQACMTHAYIEGHVDDQVRFGEVQIRTGKKREAAPEPLTLDELAALIEASEPQARAMWAVGAGEGLRPSELVRIRWEDVDWAARTLALTGDDAGDGKTSASVATIPLTPIASRELYRWWTTAGRPPSGLVFPADETGAPYTSVSGYKRLLENCATKAKIGRPVNPYLLRHSFVTIAWSLGVEMDVTRRIGRWTSDEMIKRVYCHPRPSELAARVAAFDWAAEA